MRNCHPILFETTKDIFEKAAFAVADPPNLVAQTPAEPENNVSLSVSFTGPFRGSLSIRAPEQLGRLLAANMLGVDENDPEAAARASDAFGEILNMICGNLLPAIAGSRAEFSIQSPAPCDSRSLSSETTSPNKNIFSSRIVIEGRLADILLILEGADAPTP